MGFQKFNHALCHEKGSFRALCPLVDRQSTVLCLSTCCGLKLVLHIYIWYSGQITDLRQGLESRPWGLSTLLEQYKMLRYCQKNFKCCSCRLYTSLAGVGLWLTSVVDLKSLDFCPHLWQRSSTRTVFCLLRSVYQRRLNCSEELWTWLKLGNKWQNTWSIYTPVFTLECNVQRMHRLQQVHVGGLTIQRPTVNPMGNEQLTTIEYNYHLVVERNPNGRQIWAFSMEKNFRRRSTDKTN